MTEARLLHGLPRSRTVGIALQSEVVWDLVSRRARPGERPEDVLLDLGIISERELALDLALVSGRPFEGMRGFVPDARLFLYIPLATAAAERVCPLVLVGNSLKVASVYLDPDLQLVGARFPSLDIDLVVSPRSELLEALRLVASL